MTAPNEIGTPVYPGLWECGDCGDITDVAHYVEDRMTGRMVHHRDAEARERIRSRCGWSSTYGGYRVPPLRCALPHGHHGHRHDPGVHGAGWFTEASGGRPPYDPAPLSGR